MFLLNHQHVFPPTHRATPDGIVAIGGDLNPERVLKAYQLGIFPWYEQGSEIIWWSPNPRFVLYPSKLKISKSMRSLINKKTFQVTTNTCFSSVINQCRNIHREGQEGTWITDEMERCYTHLHQKGIAHSVEVWRENELVGGLYGLKIGKVFFGESMFSTVSNASKFGFIWWVNELINNGIELIDCQVYTGHLESLGAEEIDRLVFEKMLRELVHQ